MSTQLTPFEFQSRQLRVQADEQGNPWFLAKDVCDILGYVNSRDAVKKHCKEGGVANRYIPELSNTYTFITEGNLYRLIIKSNKPEAGPFEAWVCDEVLPTIRKTGGYHADPAMTAVPTARYIALLEAKVELAELKARPSAQPGRNRRYTPEEDAFIRARLAEGWGARRTARPLGRSMDSVAHRIRRLRAMQAQGGAA